MALTHATLGSTSLVFLGGSLVLLWFVILSGVTNTSPLNRTYFLSADTSGISGARPETQWTYFYMCGSGNRDCGPAWPAPPFGWAWDRDPTGADLPTALIGSHGNGTTSTTFFYLWRFGWVLFLIALFFMVGAFFTGFLACCGRLGSALAGLASAAALFFYTAAVCLMTATFVRARNAFVAAGRAAHVGPWAFGFAWGAWACLFVSVLLFCLGARAAKDAPGGGSGMGRFGRKKSVRSRRSYDMGNHRVKDNYS